MPLEPFIKASAMANAHIEHSISITRRFRGGAGSGILRLGTTACDFNFFFLKVLLQHVSPPGGSTHDSTWFERNQNVGRPLREPYGWSYRLHRHRRSVSRERIDGSRLSSLLPHHLHDERYYCAQDILIRKCTAVRQPSPRLTPSAHIVSSAAANKRTIR